MVATGGKVEKDDVKGPDIIEQGRVRVAVSKSPTVEFWTMSSFQEFGNCIGEVCIPGLV